jgi:hypothetical protein
MMIRSGEEILFGGGRRYTVLDVVQFEEEDESPFVGLSYRSRRPSATASPVLETYAHTDLRPARKSCAGLPTLRIDDAAREA